MEDFQKVISRELSKEIYSAFFEAVRVRFPERVAKENFTGILRRVSEGIPREISMGIPRSFFNEIVPGDFSYGISVGSCARISKGSYGRFYRKDPSENL